MTSDLKTRAAIFIGTVVISVLFLAPTLFPHVFTDGWISRPIALGLDLQGGVHLMYEVDTKEAVKNYLQGNGNAIRSELRKNNVAVTKVIANDKNQVDFILLSPRLVEQAKAKIEENPELSFVQQTPEGERVRLTYSINDKNAARIANDAVNQAVETLRNRVDVFGVAEPLIQKIGDRRILLQMPGATDVEKVKKVVGSVAKLEFRLVTLDPGSGIQLQNKTGGPIRVEDQALMTGDAVKGARIEPRDGRIHVSLQLTSQGSQTFGRITSENVGRQLAIILDNLVYSAPVINEAIWGGQADISGGFSPEEAQRLAVVLRSGALPAPLNVLEERTVGPSLGVESRNKGIIAIVVGFVFIIIFLAIYYKKSGWVAVGSLLLNMVFVLAILSAFGATLSLPGLAGLGLTIGMAVDSNVLIFERIRDELRIGGSRDVSVRAGFEKALSAIVDSNVTSLLTGIVLYYFGTGPIRGFALTCCIGIVTTMYCATFVSRLAFDYWELKGARNGLSI